MCVKSFQIPCPRSSFLSLQLEELGTHLAPRTNLTLGDVVFGQSVGNLLSLQSGLNPSNQASNKCLRPGPGIVPNSGC